MYLIRKFLFLLILFVGTTNLLLAQHYYSFPDSNARWSEYHYLQGYMPGGGGGVTTRDAWLYSYGKDTLIESRKYKLLGYQKTWADHTENSGLPLAYNYTINLPGEIFGAIREDSSKRIWFRNFYSNPKFFFRSVVY